MTSSPSQEKKVGGSPWRAFGVLLACLLALVGYLLLPLAVSWIGWQVAAWHEAAEPWSPEKAFKLYIMDPIPKGVTHIQTFGALDSITSVVVVTFDEDPATFPILLERFALAPVREEDRSDCEILNFSAAPELAEAEYFEHYSTDGTSKVITIKANPSRTKVQYAYRGIDIQS